MAAPRTKSPRSRACHWSPLGARHAGEYDRRGVIALLLSVRHGLSAERAGYLCGTKPTYHDQTAAERDVAIRNFCESTTNDQ